MKLMGFNFTKIHAEKKEAQIQKININTNIDISDIHKVKSDILKTKEEIIAVGFDYSINYDPGYAKIDFAGVVLVSLEQKESEEVIKMWKEKQIPENFKVSIFNVILKKSSLRSLQLEEELNLPTHVPMPSLKVNSQVSSNAPVTTDTKKK